MEYTDDLDGGADFRMSYIRGTGLWRWAEQRNGTGTQVREVGDGAGAWVGLTGALLLATR